jgi:multidrug efflux system membrane fusion protein
MTTSYAITKIKHGRLLCVLLITVLAACSQSRDRQSSARDARTQEGAEASQPKRTEESPGTVQVTSELQHALHLKIEPLSAASAPRQIRGFGRVLDPGPLATEVNELETAQAAAAASNEEWKRTKVLQTQETASVRAVQAAEAAAVRDRLLVQTARDRIELAWGGILARRANLAGLTHALTAREQVIVRVQLPIGDETPERLLGARVGALTMSGAAVEAEFIGNAPDTDPQLQGQGFLFLTRANTLRLTPGAAVTASLQVEGPAAHGVFLPATSVLRHDGQTWVYVQTNATTFVRRPVSLDFPQTDGWLITEGLHPAERTVTQGAQVLLSEELKPQAVAD